MSSQRLRRRVKGTNSRSNRPTTNLKLNLVQINALELYIHLLDIIGQPPMLFMVRDAAEAIQQDRYGVQLYLISTLH